MKKGDLIVGETYACFARPGAARSRYVYDKPFKATLVDINFSETRWRSGSGWQGFAIERPVAGIAVDTGEKVTVEVWHGVVNKRTGEPVFVKTKHGGKSRKTVEKTYTYDYVVPENAGCILSTWADYEDSLRKEAARKAERATKLKEEAQEAEDNDPTVRDRVRGIVSRLVELAGPGAVARETIYEWRGEPDNPEDIAIYVPAKSNERDDLNLSAEPRMRRVAEIGIGYAHGTQGQRCMTHAAIKFGDRALAEILGVKS